jgi:hypothetical protein
MKKDLGDLSLTDAAKVAAGNWRTFDCFIWDGFDRADAEDWAIIYTHHRDSGLCDWSNAGVIAKALAPFKSDVIEEDHSHWACGWIKGFSIRVFQRGRITEAFRVYHELAQRMADYPILNETEYSQREYDATLENIQWEAHRLDYDLPDGWADEVYSWLANNDCTAIENTGDDGGYPGEEQIRAAFEALGYRELAGVD